MLIMSGIGVEKDDNDEIKNVENKDEIIEDDLGMKSAA